MRCGHPDPMGRYHYHIYPKCIHTSFTDAPGKHSPLIGYAFDGFAIYGPNGEDGKPPTDLDECNGHTDSIRGYHYHVSRTFPYILGGYRGVVERSDFGLPLDEPTIAARRYVQLGAGEVQAAFAKWMRPDDMVRVTQGPPPK